MDEDPFANETDEAHQRGAHEQCYADNGGHFRGNQRRAGKQRYKDGGRLKRMREENEKDLRGNQRRTGDRIRNEKEEHSRGIQRGAGERICYEKDEYLRHIQRGARKRISEENEEYSRSCQKNARERISEENEQYSRANKKSSRDKIPDENEQYTRGNQRGAKDPTREENREYSTGSREARDRIHEENEGCSRSFKRGAAWRIREENERYSNGNKKRARERIREENEEYSRSNRKKAREQIPEDSEEYSTYNRLEAREGIPEENEGYSRGNQRGPADPIGEENVEYSRGHLKGARDRIREENKEYMRRIQRGTRERSCEEHYRGAKAFRKEDIGDYSIGTNQRWNYEERTRAELDLLEEERFELRQSEEKLLENERYSRGNQRGATDPTVEENAQYSRGHRKGARDRIREENAEYREMKACRKEDIEDYSIGRDQRWNYKERTQAELDLLEKERLELRQSEEKLLENEEYSRGNQRGATDPTGEENARYSRGHRKGARDRIREENAEYREMKACRTEDIEDYSIDRDQRWNYEERTQAELDLLEKERLELRRLEEKLQSVFETADSPNDSHEHDWGVRQSPGPSTERYESPFGNRVIPDESSYHSDDDGPFWQSSQYLPKGAQQEGEWLNVTEEHGHISNSSGCSQSNVNARGFSEMYTGNRAPEAAEGKCKLTIVKVGYPKDLIDDRLQFRKIRRDILKPWRNKRWVALSDEERAKYGIRNVSRNNGKVVVTCLNSHTRDWLFRYVPFMRPFKGVQLKTIEEELEEGECSFDSEGSDRMSPTTIVEGPERILSRSTTTYEDETFVKFSDIR
nr:unnamed protein product [Callosobruchus chinensis]